MPSKCTDPEVARVTPAIASSSVVLPAPLGPTIATSSPGEIENDTWSRIVTSPRPRPTRIRRPRSATSMRTPRVGPVVGVMVVASSSAVIAASRKEVRPFVLVGEEYDRSCYLVNVTGDRKQRADGERTRDAIVRAAVSLATVDGLEGLSIGNLAGALDMSKSGIYAHFGSKQELQLATVDEAGRIFQSEVIDPALAAPAGLAQLVAVCDAFFDHLVRHTFPGGCFFAGAVLEMGTRPGPVKERIAAFQGAVHPTDPAVRGHRARATRAAR